MVAHGGLGQQSLRASLARLLLGPIGTSVGRTFPRAIGLLPSAAPPRARSLLPTLARRSAPAPRPRPEEIGRPLPSGLSPEARTTSAPLPQRA
eukprot:11042476-Alexandrium_andersonii.AAC.1